MSVFSHKTVIKLFGNIILTTYTMPSITMRQTHVGATAQSNRPPAGCVASHPQKMALRDLCANMDRRSLLMGTGAAALALTLTPSNAMAVQGITAGRIPGLSSEVGPQVTTALPTTSLLYII